MAAIGSANDVMIRVLNEIGGKLLFGINGKMHSMTFSMQRNISLTKATHRRPPSQSTGDRTVAFCVVFVSTRLPSSMAP